MRVVGGSGRANGHNISLLVISITQFPLPVPLMKGLITYLGRASVSSIMPPVVFDSEVMLQVSLLNFLSAEA